jgi:TusA-related sulfurtransferase
VSSAAGVPGKELIEAGKGEKLQTIFQDPQFTNTDKEMLKELGYEVVEDPGAFAHIGEKSLVYAIHCYADVYKKVSEEKRPAVFIGTDVENFGRFNL